MSRNNIRFSELAGAGLVIFGLIGLIPGSLDGRTGGEEPGRQALQIWPSLPPPDCPFPKSTVITGIGFTGRHRKYTGADTWYPSWAANGNMYSPWTDGAVNGVLSSSGLIWTQSPRTGYATIIGDDPLHLQIADAGTYADYPLPYEGRYPCGSLVYDGVWYYGTYCLLDSDGDPSKGLNWDILGPCVGFRTSTDYGLSWRDSPCTPARPLFGEPAKRGGPVKMGTPHFVDFGKNMQYSPDGKAYLVGHGVTDPDPMPRPANLSWGTGDQIYLVRVPPSVRNINDLSKYEFFAGHDASGEPVWVSDFSGIRPLVDWNNNCGCVTMTYNPGLKKFVLCITDAVNTISRTNTYLLESDRITGPWKLAVYMRHFGEQAYFVNIPSKFISPDGRTAWLCYASNFTNAYLEPKYKDDPPGGGYGMVLQEFKLLPKDEGRTRATRKEGR
jgi:hypothetical protein